MALRVTWIVSLAFTCLASGCEGGEQGSPDAAGVASLPDASMSVDTGSADTESADTESADTGSAVTAQGDTESPAGSSIPPDFGPPKPPQLECAIALVPVFEDLAEPQIKACRKCHSSTVPAGFAPGAGPQWLNPYVPADTVTALVLMGLLNPDNPEQSLLLLKPLEDWDGGVSHAGDGFFDTKSVAYERLLAFAMEAAPCVAAHTP
ncbi:MAG: hypothetical protein ACI9WU_000746 [Myxococcota bacterium]